MIGAVARSVRAFAFASAALLAGTAGAAPEPEAPLVAFGEVMNLYRDCRWAAAYGRFAILADAGHAESARVALLMLWHGPRLYGSEWSAPRAQIERWSRLAGLNLPAFSADGGD